MPKIYSYLLDDLLGPLVGLADHDETVRKYWKVNPNDPNEIKEIIRTELLPTYLSCDAVRKRLSKLCLMYYLTTSSVPFGRVYDSCLIPFDHPANPRDFFLWIWEVFFPGEDYILSNPDQYVVDNRPNVTYAIPPEEQ